MITLSKILRLPFFGKENRMTQDDTKKAILDIHNSIRTKGRLNMSTSATSPAQAQQTGTAPAVTVQAVNPVLNQITIQTLTYAPTILGAILAAEQVPGATGQQKLNAVLMATTQSLESSPNANVAEIAALANVAVSVWNILGLFSHKTPPPPLTPVSKP